MKSNSLLGLGVLLSATLAVSACENTREGAERDAEIAGQRSEEAADRTADSAREAARDAREGVGDATAGARVEGREAGQAARESAGDAVDGVRGAARDVAAAGDAAQQTAQIKTALIADEAIDASDINVDTMADTKSVVLKGTVKTAAQKASAERIAKSKAPGYTVVNRLDVRP